VPFTWLDLLSLFLMSLKVGMVKTVEKTRVICANVAKHASHTKQKLCSQECRRCRYRCRSALLPCSSLVEPMLRNRPDDIYRGGRVHAVSSSTALHHRENYCSSLTDSPKKEDTKDEKLQQTLRTTAASISRS